MRVSVRDEALEVAIFKDLPPREVGDGAITGASRPECRWDVHFWTIVRGSEHAGAYAERCCEQGDRLVDAT